MAAKVGTGYVTVEADLSPFNRRVAREFGGDRRWRQLGRTAAAGLTAGLTAGAVGAGVVLKQSVDAAVDLGEELNKTNVIFGRRAKGILDWSRQTATSLGLSRRQALEAAGNFGGMFKVLGQGEAEAARMGKRMVELAADMASFNNASPEEALDALRSGLSGETEPLRRFRVFLSEARVAQEALNLGLVEGGEELSESDKATARYSLILKQTTDAQGDFARTSRSLANAKRTLRAQVEDVSGSIGQLFVPAVEDAAAGAVDLLDGLDEIASRPDLDVGEKIQLGRDTLRRRLAPLAAQFGEAVESADIGDKLERAVEFAVPRIASAAADAAPRAAAAFFDAWRESDAAAKLVIGGALFAKMGGASAFRSLGTRAGSAMGDALATQTASTAATRFAGLRSRFVGIGKGLVGVAVVAGIADALTREDLGGLTDRLQQFFSTATVGLVPEPDTISERLNRAINQALTGGSPRHAGFDQFFEELEGRLPESERRVIERFRGLRMEAIRAFGPDVKLRVDIADPERAREQIRLLTNEWGRMRSGAVTNTEDMRRVVESQLRRISQTVGLRTAEGKEAVRRNFTEAADWIRRSMSDGRGLTARGGKEMERLLKLHTGRGRDGLRGNMDDVIAIISRTMRRGGRVTDEGLALIRKAFEQELRFYGFTPEQARNEAAPGTRFDAGPEEGSRGPVRRQRGGPIFDGRPTGDSVPALLERGEYVLNRNAVRRVGRDVLDRINFAAAPRFQTGGIVELLHPFNDPAGHGGSNSHLHVAARTVDAIVALGRRLQQMGWLVSEHPAFGGVRARHAPNSYHYRNLAIDANWPNAAEEGAKIRALLPMLGGLSAAEAAEIRRIVVSGPDSPLKAIMQAGLDQARAAAQARLTGLSGSIEGVELGAAVSGDAKANMALGRQLAARYGWASGPQWAALVELWNRESGWNNLARNPTSGAFGIPQALPPSKMGSAAVAGDAAAQIAWGLRYIRGRYGSPAAALGFHNSHNWYQRGGLVGALLQRFQRGGRVNLGSALGGLRSSNRSVRTQALNRVLESIKKVGLPDEMQKDLERLQGDAAKYGDFAARANQLTVEGADGEPILGKVDGFTEAEWLTRQLETLFKWRNLIVDAEKIVEQRRDEVTKLLYRARNRLREVTDTIRSAAGERRDLAARLERARKNPRRNRELIKRLRDRIKEIDNAQPGRERVRDGLRGRIIPALTEQREGLNTARGDLLTGLEEIQGAGSPMERLNVLPPLGVFGGRIFETQIRLRDLNERPRVTDTGSPGGTEADSERVRLLEEELRLSRLRTAASEAQFDVFRNFPPYGGEFAEGGSVPGPVGAPRTIVAHGGELVLNPDQQAGLVPEVHVHIADGMGWLRQFVRVEARQTSRDEARRAARGLPGVPV